MNRVETVLPDDFGGLLAASLRQAEGMIRDARPLREFINDPRASVLTLFQPNDLEAVPTPWHQRPVRDLGWHVGWCFNGLDGKQYLWIDASGSIAHDGSEYGWSRETILRVDADYASVLKWLAAVREAAVSLWPTERGPFLPGRCHSCSRPVASMEVEALLCSGVVQGYVRRDLCRCEGSCHPWEEECLLSRVEAIDHSWLMEFVRPPEEIVSTVPDWNGGNAWDKVDVHFTGDLFSYPVRQRLEIHARNCQVKVGWETSAIFLDVDCVRCIQWFRRLEAALQTVWSRITFHGRVGYCVYCGARVEARREAVLSEDNVKDCAQEPCVSDEFRIHGRQLFELPYLKFRHRRSDQGIRQRARQRPIISDPGASVLDQRIRRVVWRVYGGKCQYCALPVKLPPGGIVLEHIIPTAVPLAEVAQRLRAMGVTAATVREFCERFLPPRHDCVLNYSLACSACNLKKGPRLLHPVALEVALAKARRKAKRMLELYNAVD